MTQQPGLRERKRHDTRRRIIDSATRLVAEHGFEAVTVEQICAEAGISRRTFFNYMESKDEAVLGPLPVSLDAETAARIIDTPTDNLVDTLLGALAHSVADRLDLGDTQFQCVVRQRRQAIVNAEPTLALISYNRIRELGRNLLEIVTAHLTAHPDVRIAPQQPIVDEALVIVGVIRESLLLTTLRTAHSGPPDPPAIDATSLHATWTESARLLSTISQGVHW